MAENITVSPTPIQRNAFDVAMELLTMHQQKSVVEAEDISEIFAKYYTLANTLQKKSASDLKAFLPEEIRSKL
ncbi:hypothetical protein ACFFIX_06540 [Metabacillus herbersteinensis]|uniref:Uncharacterized protein n=1 Tax=Metabacillus herbersteinensis TaxID=283816 RepID=A0ABV6GCA3_9BACI